MHRVSIVTYRINNEVEGITRMVDCSRILECYDMHITWTYRVIC